MNQRQRFSLTVLTVTAAALGAADWFWQPAAADSSFCPAYFQPGNPPRLRLFPIDGSEETVSLPARLPVNTRAIAFSADGEALYAQTTNPLDRSAGIYKIEFQPARESVLPGSIGMGEVWCLAVSQSPGRITVAGWSWSQNSSGIFEIDPASAAVRALPAGSASACGGGGGVMSPDGKRTVTPSGKQLGLVDIKTGAVTLIKGTNTDMQSAWSPDGRWIAGVRDGKIILIDADEPDQPRRLGSSGDGPLVWSPDSRYLLLRTAPLSCAVTLYGESLEVVEVETGRRKVIKSSHCTITAGTVGWLHSSLVQ